MIRAALLTVGTAALIGTPPAHTLHARTAPNVLVVKMVDKSPTQFAFEPAVLTVKPGDVVRFEMTSVNVHNVEFKSVPSGADLGASKTSGFMIAPGQKFEITIDKRFPKGTYKYTCTPHEAMGMNGTLIVTDP